MQENEIFSSKDELKRFKLFLENEMNECDNVVIVPHSDPDYDAIGSAIGLTLIPKKMKKTSYVLVNDPSYKISFGLNKIIEEAKNSVNFINKDEYLSLSGKNLTILTDVSNRKLISVGEEIKDKEVIVIDHHAPTPYLITGKYNYVDINASSASEIVTRLLKLFKIKIPAEISNYLLSGIYLDTNKFEKITEKASEAMTDLFKYGASMDIVKKWFVESLESYKKVQDVIKDVKFLEYKIAITVGDGNTEYRREELAKAADELLKFDTDASFAIGKIDKDTISISARGSKDIDVGMIMRELDGGGNARSAATKIEGESLDEVHKKLVKVLMPSYYKKEEIN